jgi:hypothetical protein
VQSYLFVVKLQTVIRKCYGRVSGNFVHL